MRVSHFHIVVPIIFLITFAGTLLIVPPIAANGMAWSA